MRLISDKNADQLMTASHESRSKTEYLYAGQARKFLISEEHIILTGRTLNTDFDRFTLHCFRRGVRR